MKINTNANPVGEVGPVSPKRSAPAALPAEETTSFAGSAAVNSALRSAPDSRPGAVEQARALINDPEYPGPEVLGKVSRLLAGQIGGAGE